jgi:hypothetical protein
MAEEAPATSGHAEVQVEGDNARSSVSGHGDGEGNTRPLDPEALKIQDVDGEGDVAFDDVCIRTDVI